MYHRIPALDWYKAMYADRAETGMTAGQFKLAEMGLHEGEAVGLVFAGMDAVPGESAASGALDTAGESGGFWSSTRARSSVENAYSHWVNHGEEFPEYSNAKQYVEGTHDFVNNPPDGTLTSTRANGDSLFYHQDSNTFAVTKSDGTPRTMFRPSRGIDYWNDQIR